MALQISDTTPRIQYTATSGQTSFSVPFEFFDVADLKVYNGTTLLTYSTSPASASQYSVTGAGVTGGGSITLGGSGATLNDKITIVRDLAIERISDFPVSGNFPIQTLNTELDKIVAMLQQLEEQFARTLQYPVTTTTGFNVDLPELVANRVLSVNADATALLANQELGTFQGNWAASTSYKIRDLVKDTSNGNIYFVNTAHTSSGTQPLSSNANSSYYDLIVDAASATTSATNAASSATAASTSATAAANSATAAATSETNAANSESNASTSESNASTSATNASNSATAAATSATNAATSETNAATSATNAATSETNASTSATNAASSATSAAGSATTATTQASAASTSATNAATSESNAATSASNASTSETNAANSATSASTSATNASTSATNASNSATAAANSAAAAASSYDTFDDRYLGSKTSDPTLDNDGNALVTGALYFNSSANEMRVYDGANWIAASSAGTASLIIYEYTATSGQTTFSGTDDNAASLSYSVNNLFVTLNGVVLDPDDYTATSGTSIVLGTGATTGDLLTVHAFKSFTVSELNANNLTDGTIPDARFPSVLPAVDGSNLTGITSVGGAVGVDFNDNVKARFGTGNDLEIYHDGSHSYVKDNGTGNLILQASSAFKVENTAGTETYIYAGENGAVELKYDNSTKLATTSSGVDVTGTNATQFSSGGDQRSINSLTLRNPNETQYTFAGISLYAGDGTGADWTIANVRQANYEGDLVFKTRTGASSFAEKIRVKNSGNVGIGTSSPSFALSVSSASSNTITAINTASNISRFCFAENSTPSNTFTNIEGDARSNGYMAFRTNDTERMRIDSSGHVLPGATNTYDLGSSSLVWRNIYTSDFHMSNEGLDKGNDIDGTKGSWTFQEGEENLYLINNKNGKKYKFNLTEIE